MSAKPSKGACGPHCRYVGRCNSGRCSPAVRDPGMSPARKAAIRIGEAVWRARRDAGVSLRALATVVGVSAPFISDIENGNRKLSTVRLADFDKALGASGQIVASACLCATCGGTGYTP